MTNVYQQGREAIEILADDSRDLPTPNIEIRFHDVSNEDALAIVGNFPGMQWEALAGGSSEWLAADSDDFSITIFLRTEAKVVSTVAQSVLEQAGL